MVMIILRWMNRLFPQAGGGFGRSDMAFPGLLERPQLAVEGANG
jgi:hypothetical protein